MQINFSDFLPGGKVIPWKQSLEALHFPKQLEGLEQYKQRLALDELVLLHLTAMIHKQKWQNTKLAHAFKVDFVPVDKFISSLSFTLTVSQRRSINEIASDLSKKQAMNRLLQGDVGSGKTIVAATAAYISYLNNFQTLVLAPTQILADQHLQTFTNIFKNTDVKLGHVTGAIKNYSPDSNIIIGTHALLSKNIDFTKVGLVIIDEQHRFGVAQRGLAAAKGQTPHVLTMTATPIPRTIALTLFSDLDLSVLDELPQGRKTVKTWVVPESKRSSAYSWVKKQLTDQKSQCFWVCPLIDESETLADVKSVTHEFEQVKNIFSDLKVGLLHGRMPAKQKTETLKLMQDKKIDILVCTPVVEVGIDIPNATIMAIETAERFGLAQLHQLRGRVGRGDKSSYCLLFSTKPTPRLQAMETHYSGMKLAEIDMQMRGAGDILGTSQHGLPSFKVANYTDTVAIAQAQKLAKELILDLPNLPLLRSLVEKDKIGLVQPN